MAIATPQRRDAGDGEVTFKYTCLTFLPAQSALRESCSAMGLTRS